MAQMKTEEKSVMEYLSKGNFIIPMYQRPYTWGEDECSQLWQDIVEFFNDSDKQKDDKYFLGSIVTYTENDKKEQNIIDGQQRTTTLMLLIKALHIKAFKDKSDKTKNLVAMIESCLWETDDKSGEADYKAIRLQSEVATDDDVEVLNTILQNEYVAPSDLKELEVKIKQTKTAYEKNYLYFLLESSKFAKEYPTQWADLCITLLKSCIVLPIECDSQDNALRIFNTLNNRGKPLSDADIFKGIIYGSKKDKQSKNDFAKNWKQLESDNNGDMNFIFRNYMHIVRARENDKTNEIGLREFFANKHKDILTNDSDKVMTEINQLSDFWGGSYDDKISQRSLQLYEVLDYFPNDYWRYLDSAYFMYCNDKKLDYFDKHDEFLAKVIAHFLVKFINKPSVAEIKPIVFNAYTALYNTGKLDFQTNTKEILQDEESFKVQFFKADKLIPSLLRLNLYLQYPDQELGIKAEIEHIFPKTTQWRSSYTGWDKDEAKPFVESIGNKIWLEKRLNIKASNNYFDDKKDKYAKSKFLEAQKLAKLPQNDWLKEDIEKRKEEIYTRLRDFFASNV
ncbi:DUF262 domain-containing protein [Helicobacter canis]|uniref:DUF262 domain-containing protein n=1 Tax=Helicobacter canis TaxID=29419 RepID=A0A5M9QJ51_9HELI|nr:DUF262 domain-containing protein [Helicobacter canis]KAA8707622.1 DUF262 domain-containing protein [Helicobacter canis]